MTAHPRELDVVRLRENIAGWPEGTPGTVVDERASDATVEVFVEGADDLFLIDVPYSALELIGRAHALA